MKSGTKTLGYNWRDILANLPLQKGDHKDKDAISGADVLRDNSYIALYFGCEWHPICKNDVNPQLIKIYHHLKAIRDGTDRDVEIIYVSLDRDIHAFERFICTMPWLTVQYGDKEQLVTAFQVKKDDARKIPKIVVLDTSNAQDGNMNNRGIINKDAFPELHLRMKKDSDEKLAKEFPWGVSAAGRAATGMCALMFCSIQ
mmetsp:Transcript_15892/g.27085  ORF Transcript_15892/g.27085 Transcript_15892/m.27085 type:complete len:200 (+) Transcript_15892:336-935(+)|eukprot:CAMPEP_0183711290 /NCGR_PEP_ID=MMETSP0737-20130205/6827_1 /TAXON_ID=385413 /ORGANISM="Thalassiosira miniscula, Strain CCMP1093" /LENGTH=199 /DNA_ID=CAMNT_0025939761 /DNA_START=166 /DNA_END=765 /DNA_ORIENTATION=-